MRMPKGSQVGKKNTWSLYLNESNTFFIKILIFTIIIVQVHLNKYYFLRGKPDIQLEFFLFYSTIIL